jgi:hypothetical protein
MFRLDPKGFVCESVQKIGRRVGFDNDRQRESELEVSLCPTGHVVELDMLCKIFQQVSQEVRECFR